jgi:hypothetical protein
MPTTGVKGKTRMQEKTQGNSSRRDEKAPAQEGSAGAVSRQNKNAAISATG